MLTDVDHSVCHDPSLLSEFKEAGEPRGLLLRRLGSTHGAPLLLNCTTGSQRVVCFVWRQKIAGDIYWLLLKWVACRCVAWSKSGETPSHSFTSIFLMQKYILGVHSEGASEVLCMLVHDPYMTQVAEEKLLSKYHVLCQTQFPTQCQIQA